MKKLTAWTLLMALYFGSIAPMGAAVQAQIIGKTMEQRMKDTPTGLRFSLSEGVEGAETREKQQLAPTDPLSETAAKDLLKRIPEIKPETDDKVDFAKRIGTLPAPKTGTKLSVKFPSDDQRGTPKIDMSGQTLQVIRYSPDGDVPLAPDLSVTFSQPMVAVASQEQAAKYAPIELRPQVEGNWRWLGTKTLMFDTTKRFPMATKFTARVPAGTKSATGQALQKDVVWTFTTPPPKVERMIPSGGITRRDALMCISFDQAINPDSVVKTIYVTSGGKRIPIRLATQEEINSDTNILFQSKQAQPDRWIAFRAVNSDGLTENALPPAATINVSVEKGTPSAEGPLTTTTAQNFSFQTYSPLKFVAGYCGWRENKNCTPFEILHLEFNNQIDVSKFDKELIKIEPAVEGLNIYPSGNRIYVQGYKKGRTTYKVTIDGAIFDDFGQSLGQTATTSIKVGSADATLYAQGGAMTVMDPTASPTFSIYSTNHSSARVRLYRVKPEDWHQYANYYRRLNYDDGQRPAIPGTLVSDKVIAIAN
ncbi:MAG: Ig-like domain-containing protein, partial [Pyrinomonadaceae bacterium]